MLESYSEMFNSQTINGENKLAYSHTLLILNDNVVALAATISLSTYIDEKDAKL